MAVDGHVADPGHTVAGQPVGDQLGAPLLVPQQAFEGCVDALVVVPDPARLPAPAIGSLLGLARPVGAIGGMAGIAADLAADRARVATQEPGDRATAHALPLQNAQGVSFRLGELVVHEGSSLAGVIPSSLPAHLFILGRRGCCTYFVNPRALTIHSSRRRFAARLSLGVSAHSSSRG